MGKRARAVAFTPRRLRGLLRNVAIVAVLGLLWFVQLHMVVWYRLSCENLTHRDERFVRDENAYLCLSDGELAAQLRAIAVTAAAVLEAHNLTYFLDSGSLLGAFREKRVIRHDTDVDFGIDVASFKYLRTHHVRMPKGYVLDVWDSALYPETARDIALPVRITHVETALYADVFVFLDGKIGNQDAVGPIPSRCFTDCRNCPRVGDNGAREFKIPREWVYPVASCLFEGRVFKCPRETPKYLQHMFGDDFMTPR